MKLTLVLDDEKYGWLLTKEDGDAEVAQKNIMDKVNEYLDACGRDVGASDMAKVQAALADPEKLAIAKEALSL